jgi:hypothetical protein
MKQTVMHIMAIFIFVYVGVEVTIGGSSTYNVLGLAANLGCVQVGLSRLSYVQGEVVRPPVMLAQDFSAVR